MKDQVEGLRANGVPAAALNSMNDEAESARVRAACLRGVETVVYFARTPDVGASLSDKGHESVLVCSGRSALYLAMGHDFRPEYAQLGLLRQTFPDVPIVALTATADRLTREDIQKQLALSDPVVFISSFDCRTSVLT